MPKKRMLPGNRGFVVWHQQVQKAYTGEIVNIGWTTYTQRDPVTGEEFARSLCEHCKRIGDSYRLVNAAGEIVEEHKSELMLAFEAGNKKKLVAIEKKLKSRFEFSSEN